MTNGIDIHTSSSTAQLCPSYGSLDHNAKIVEFGIDNPNFEAINLDNIRRDEREQGVAVKKQKWYKSLKGMSLTIMSALFFSITTVIVKYVKDVEPEQMAFVRFAGNYHH